MATPNINNNPSHTANLSYSGFDTGNLLKFSSTVGQLIPVYYDILAPGDKVNFKSIIKTRTQPLESAAMTHLTEHVDWFFVPIEQIWRPFGAFYYGVQDFTTNFYNKRTYINYFPFMKAGDIYAYIAAARSGDNVIDQAGYSSIFGNLRLLESLGIPINRLLNGNDLSAVTSPVTPLFAACYQKIYYDHYRLDNYVDNDPSYYNLDTYVGDSYNFPVDEFVDKLLTMRYRPFAKDYFTNLYPSPLIGGNSISSTYNTTNLLTQVNQWLTGLKGLYPGRPSDNTQLPQGGSTTTDQSLPTTVKIGRTGQVTSPTAIDVLTPPNLRTMFATEKLLEITRRAGKHYDKQTLAHFGVHVNNVADGEVRFLGSESSVINIGDVVSQSATSEAPLGEIAGKGYAFGSGKNKSYTADKHGVLMAIYSCEPSLDYDLAGIDKLNQLVNSADWFKPEYSNLGMQPLFGIQADVDPGDVQNNIILGWQYRYTEFKQKYDRVIGNLTRNMSFWTTARKAMSVRAEDNMIIHPNYLDSIMTVSLLNVTDPNISDEQFKAFDSTDPLIHEFYLDVKKASKMSVYGLPSL